MAAKIDLNPVGNFDVSGDRLGQSWTRCLRSFELYATGKGVDDKTKESIIIALCRTRYPDAQVRDQVIEKCRSNKLRTRLLEKGPGLTLDDVRTIARTLEMAEKHSREMEGATGYGNNPSSTHGSVNRVNQRKPTQYGQNKTKTKSGLKCYRCGREGHFGKDPSCPAQGKT
ncbi:unnamed protein product [Mytilus edulis]|uniref:CCHC-type domain-containing protein n=1 Tax=Mytilus edulis TaxID=6550 RepID=A0A8S3TGU6_MYTED|nr:unnamed protein product [Mytilus edulis]